MTGESRSLLGAPVVRHGPQQFVAGRDALGERRPLGVAHYPFLGPLDHTREFPSRNQRGTWRTRVPALRGHDVGEIHPSGRNFDQRLSGVGHRLRNLLYLKDLWAA